MSGADARSTAAARRGRQNVASRGRPDRAGTAPSGACAPGWGRRLAEPGFRDDERARRGGLVQPVEAIARSVSARSSGEVDRAPMIGNGFTPTNPARPPSSTDPGSPGPLPSCALPSCPRDRLDGASAPGPSPSVAANDTDGGSAASTLEMGRSRRGESAVLGPRAIDGRSGGGPSRSGASRWSPAAVLGMPGMLPGAAHRRLISPRIRSRS